MKKKVIPVVMILVLIFAFAGCTTYDNFINAYGNLNKTETAPTIKIGVYEPMTGKYKSYGKEEAAGIEIAHSLFPRVLGMEVELIYADNCSDMYEAETALKELINIHPNVVLGSYGDLLTVVASDYLTAESIPAITISATNPLITSNSGYYFTVSLPESQTGTALADYAVNNALRDSFATVRVARDDVAQETVKRFTNRLEKLTDTEANQAANLTIDQDETDYTATIEVLKESGANCVFLATSVTIAENFMDKCLEMDYSPLFLGTTEWDDEKFQKYLSKSEQLNVAYISNQMAEDTKMYQKFLEAYSQQYGVAQEPSAYVRGGFDAYILAIRAISDAYETAMDEDKVNELIQNAPTEAQAKALTSDIQTVRESGIPTGSLIRNALRNMNDFEGASGILSYNGTNEASKHVTITHYYRGTEMPTCVIG